MKTSTIEIRTTTEEQKFKQAVLNLKRQGMTLAEIAELLGETFSK